MTLYRFIFWKEGQVFSQSLLSLTEIKEALELLPCVDTWYPGPQARYGRFNKEEASTWEHVPLEDFPPEFRATLLLLGVPT